MSGYFHPGTVHHVSNSLILFHVQLSLSDFNRVKLDFFKVLSLMLSEQI